MKKYNMSAIAWFLPMFLLVVSASQAATTECTRPAGRSKIFVKCGKAIVQEDIPFETRKSLSSIYPNSKILSDDLDRDGVKDYVIYATESTLHGSVDRIIILKGKPDGAYELVTSSSDIEYGKGDIELKKRSIFLRIDSSSLEETYNEIFQFQFREGGYFLIGKEENSYSHENGVPLEESRTSTNYLTGSAITTKKSKGIITKIIKKVVDRRPTLLEDFSR